MSTPTPEQSRKALHYAAIGVVVACPILIALPPRKLNIITALNVVGFSWGTNQLVKEYTGHSVIQKLAIKMSAMSGSELPSERARQVQARLRAERLAKESPMLSSPIKQEKEGKEEVVVEEATGALKGVEAQAKELASKVWMGGEGEDWKVKRDAREKEALEEGRGYGDLIMDQIWEVWNWGRGSAEDGKKKDDEEIVKKK